MGSGRFILICGGFILGDGGWWWVLLGGGEWRWVYFG